MGRQDPARVDRFRAGPAGEQGSRPFLEERVVDRFDAAADPSDTFRGWGWQQLSGDLRPGGRIRGRLAFEKVYENKKDHIGPIPYRWDLEFDGVMP